MSDFEPKKAPAKTTTTMDKLVKIIVTISEVFENFWKNIFKPVLQHQKTMNFLVFIIIVYALLVELTKKQNPKEIYEVIELSLSPTINSAIESITLLWSFWIWFITSGG